MKRQLTFKKWVLINETVIIDSMINSWQIDSQHSARCPALSPVRGVYLFLITSHLGFLFSAVRISSGRAKTAGLRLSLISVVLHRT